MFLISYTTKIAKCFNLNELKFTIIIYLKKKIFCKRNVLILLQHIVIMGTPSHLIDKENELRSMNDRLFPILIVGERGTGKSYLLKNIPNIQKVSDASSLKKQLEQDTPEMPLLIDLIEYVTFEEQKQMYYYITKRDKEYLLYIKKRDTEVPARCPQLFFTTHKSIRELYRDTTNYKPFIDHISEQVIVIEPLRRVFEKNEDAFRECWESVNDTLGIRDTTYAKFLIELNKILFLHTQKTIRYEWLGNFRDLEKLAIRFWRFAKTNNFQVPTEAQVLVILRQFKEEIEPELHSAALELTEGIFQVDKSAEDIFREFRKSLVAWAEKTYGDRSKIVEKLQISEKTYYNWKNESKST